MNRKFNVGDRVRVVSNGPLNGTITTVTSDLTTTCPDCKRPIEIDGARVSVHQVDLPTARADHGRSCHACLLPENLEPYYDGNEKVSWSSCVWQPIQTRV